MSECNGCCSWCAGFLFTLGLTALVLWLSFRPSKPGLSVESLYIPALNRTSAAAVGNSTSPPANTTISFSLRLKNRNRDKGVDYGDLNVTLLFRGESEIPAGSVAVAGFYQGFEKKKVVRDAVEGNGTGLWEAVSRRLAGGGRATFRVRVATRVRYKIMAWKTKRKGLILTRDVEVDEQGKKAGAGVLSLAPTAAGICCALNLLVLGW